MIWQTNISDEVVSFLSSFSTETAAPKDGQIEATKKELTIHDCFEELSKEQILDEDDKWHCPKCKDFVKAT